jgi:hypothetical protein
MNEECFFALESDAAKTIVAMTAPPSPKGIFEHKKRKPSGR